MVMEIIEGKFYKTRDGRKAEVFKIVKTLFDSLLLAYYKTEEGNEGVVYALSGRGNHEEGPDHPSDLIAEWQDEPKKEISDMSEVKFKVGDFIRKPLAGWNKQGYEVAKIVGSLVYLKPYPDSSSIHSYNIGSSEWEIVKSAPNTSVPEIGTKWVFNDGQDFVVRVVGFNDKGQIVLEALSNKNFDVFGALKTGRLEFIEVGSYFTFENEPEKFGEFYKPWVEKPKSVTGYARIELDKRTGEILVWAEGHDTEEAARNHFDSGEGSYELLDVVKVEWSE